jgi:hypothetical protein
MSQHYPPHHPHAQSALNYSMNNKYSSNLKLPLIETNAPLQLATGPILYDYWSCLVVQLFTCLFVYSILIDSSFISSFLFILFSFYEYLY